jgi:hypothetical protein
MNFALIIALLIILILIIVCVIVLFRNVNETITEKGAYVLNINSEPCYPNGDVNQLPEVNSNCNCIVNDAGTNTYAYSVNNLEFILSDSPIYYKEVCQSFCTAFNTKGVCQDAIIGTGPYAVCLNTLAPVTQKSTATVSEQCTQPSLPLARINSDPYYAVGKYAPSKPNDPGNCTLSSLCNF